MNDHPRMMTISTIVTFVTTINPFSSADSFVPRISTSVRTSRMNTAGRFMIPCETTPEADVIVSIGE